MFFIFRLELIFQTVFCTLKYENVLNDCTWVWKKFNNELHLKTENSRRFLIKIIFHGKRSIARN